MKWRYLGFLVLGLLVYLSQLNQNSYIEPNPQRGPSSVAETVFEPPFRISSYSLTDLRVLAIVNAKNNRIWEGRSFKDNKTYYYAVDILTGQLSQLDWRWSEIGAKTKCLNSHFMNRLHDILMTSSICESPRIEHLGVNVDCGNSYTLPSIVLKFENGKMMSLGEKNTPCDFPTQLCGDSQDALIVWSQDLILQLKNLKCPIGQTPDR